MHVFQNMELFSELIQCGGNIYTWCYNADGSLLQSNCPEAGFLSGAFEIFGCKKKMLDYGSRHTTPVTLGTAIGMTWAAAFEKDGSVLKRAWVIGPVFYQDVSLRGIEQGLQYYNRLETSVAWTMQLYEVLKTVPVLQCTVLAPLRADDALLSDRQPPCDQRHQQRVFGAGAQYSAAARSRSPQGLDGRAGTSADGAHR